MTNSFERHRKSWDESVSLECLATKFTTMWCMCANCSFEPRRKYTVVGRKCDLVETNDVDHAFG